MNVLVTGASRGLGYWLAVEGASRGHRVFAGVRSLSAAERFSAEKHAVVPVLLDVTDESSVEHAAETVRRDAGSLDVLVNNAAVLLARDVPIERLDIGDVRRTFEVNLFGPIVVVKQMLPLLERSVRPIVVNISSEAGSSAHAYGGDYPYALSKAALNMFSIQLDRLFKPRGGRAISVHPGWIRTDMGGERAPGDPADAARRIWELIERGLPEVDPPFVGVDGRPMPL